MRGKTSKRMTMEEMKESITKLAENLLKVGARLDNHLLSTNREIKHATGRYDIISVTN